MSESKFEDTSFGEDDFDLGGEETFMETSGTAEEIRFDEAVGALEDILVCDDEFRSIQEGFFDAHCDKFSEDEENRVEYTAIFEDYTTLMETTLERILSAKVSGFNMHEFEKQLINRKEDIAGEIFDLLLSFSDFQEFKSLIVAHKLEKEGGGLQFGDLLCVTNIKGTGEAGDNSMQISGSS